MEAKYLTIKNIYFSYNTEPIFSDLSFEFPHSSLIAILGTSGCGKTTLLKCLSGLLKPQKGTINLEGNTPMKAKLDGNIGFAFQNPILLQWRDVKSNVLLPLELINDNKIYDGLEYSKFLLNKFGLRNVMDKYPYELSGGMQQRVGLARALITKPKFLFLDEPFGQLDGLTRDRLNEEVHQIWQELDVTLVFVTHSIEEAVFLADFIVILNNNKPTSIKAIEKIDLGEIRTVKTRNEKFYSYTKKIRELTNDMIWK